MVPRKIDVQARPEGEIGGWALLFGPKAIFRVGESGGRDSGSSTEQKLRGEKGSSYHKPPLGLKSKVKRKTARDKILVDTLSEQTSKEIRDHPPKCRSGSDANSNI